MLCLEVLNVEENLFCEVPKEVKVVLLQPSLNGKILQNLLDLYQRKST